MFSHTNVSTLTVVRPKGEKTTPTLCTESVSVSRLAGISADHIHNMLQSVGGY